MNVQQTKNVSVFPVDGIYSVYEDDGKMYKEKIIAIAAYTLNDAKMQETSMLYFKIISLSDINGGGVDLNFAMSDDDNFMGVIDDKSNWIELSENELLIHSDILRK
ncbi:MAG: hypothetical protein WCK09_18560 [Bacteroidota bacterium]